MIFLKAIRRRLQQDVNRVDQLISQASAPRLPGEGGVSERIRKIVSGIKSKGGKVTKQELADIASSAGITAYPKIKSLIIRLGDQGEGAEGQTKLLE